MDKSNYKMAAALVILLAVGALLPASRVRAEPLTLTAPLDSHDSESRETTFGDLVADAVLAAAPGADFAVAPAAEVRPDTIDSGQTTTERLTDALRAESDSADTVVTMRLTGAQVRAALAHGLSRAPGPYDGFLQVSGLSVHYDPAKHGEQRVTGVTVTRSGAALNGDSTYTVAMPRYLADGALGYFDIWAKAAPPSDTHTPVTQAVTSYAEAHQPVSYHIEGRIAGS